MSVHRLKTHDTWYARVAEGQKTAEIRKHDRDFQTGDTLHLIETWETDGRHLDEEGNLVWHTKDRETGRGTFVTITHVLPAEQFPDGLCEGYCLLSFKRQAQS